MKKLFFIFFSFILISTANAGLKLPKEYQIKQFQIEIMLPISIKTKLKLNYLLYVLQQLQTLNI